jgi:hypothetical protein
MPNKKLVELLELLGDNANARAYLIYRGCGYSSQDILELLNLNSIYASNLRQTNSAFREADDFINEHGRFLKSEAQALRWELVRDNGLLFADKLIQRAAREPDSLAAADKRLALSALSELRKLSKPGGGKALTSSYDAAVLARGSR